MGNKGSVTDHVCGATFDTEDIACDARRHCQKKMKVSHTDNFPIANRECKNFWKEACAKEGEICEVDAVVSIDFNNISGAETTKHYEYMFDKQNWKTNAKFIYDFMETIRKDFPTEHGQLTRYVSAIRDYTIEVMNIEKSILQHQNNEKRRQQIGTITKKYNELMDDSKMWKYLEEHKIEYKKRLNATIGIIHRNMMNKLNPQPEVPWTKKTIPNARDKIRRDW